MRSRPPAGVRVALLLAPAFLVVGVLFLGGLGLGVAQSLGYQPYLDDWSWTLRHYTGLVDDPAVRASLGLTARIAVLSTALSAVAGLGIALLIRSTARGRRLITTISQLALPVPHLVGAFAMTLLLSQSGLLSRLAHAVGLTGQPADFPALTQDAFGWAIVAEYVWKESPFVAVVVLAALVREIEAMEDVALTLGARPWQRFRAVLLPLVAPSLAAAGVIVFAFTFGSYEVGAVLGRSFPAPLPVVALQRYSDSDLAIRPQADAISVLIAVVTAVAAWACLRLVDRLTVPR